MPWCESYEKIRRALKEKKRGIKMPANNSMSKSLGGGPTVETAPGAVPAKESSGYSAPIIYKAFAILQEVSKDQGNLGISDLSRLLNINKSTVYGIIQAFLDLGVLRQDESKKYRLGPTLNQLGNQSLVGISLRALARPYMTKIAHEFGQTVFLVRFDEYGITIIESAESPLELKFTAPVGTRIPFFAGAPPKAFLLYLEEQVQLRILQERTLPKFTDKSILDEEVYMAELKKSRHQGYATDFGEYMEGVNAISVPLSDTRGILLAALWIVGLSSSFNEQKMQEVAMAAKEAAAKILDNIQ